MERDFLLEDNETFAETVQFISGDHSATVEEISLTQKMKAQKKRVPATASLSYLTNIALNKYVGIQPFLRLS